MYATWCTSSRGSQRAAPAVWPAAERRRWGAASARASRQEGASPTHPTPQVPIDLRTPCSVDASPLLTLLAAASLIDSFNYYDGQQGADSGGGSSTAGRAAAVSSGSRAKLKTQLIQKQLIQRQGEGANQNAKGSSRQPSSPAPAPSPAEPGRLTERQQLQRAIEESLLAHGGALQSLTTRIT